jgi:hypothetical protein
MTNFILKSVDRVLFDTTIRQQTENSFLCISDLTEAYNRACVFNNWTRRDLYDIYRYQDFKERLYELLFELKIINTIITVFMENINSKGFIKYMKELKLWQVKGRGDNKVTYCNPYIWIMLAMEMNPKLYAKVVVWLTDTLIFNRLDACQNYQPMTDQLKDKLGITREQFYIYINIAKELNKKVFGYHETGMRNIASKEDLKKIRDIEFLLSEALRNKWIKTIDEIYSTIQNYEITTNR